MSKAKEEKGKNFESKNSSDSNGSDPEGRGGRVCFSRENSGSWERHPILDYLRSGWSALIRVVTPQSIETVRKAGPYAIFLYLVLTLFGMKKVNQDPRSRKIYAKIAHFARTRYAKLFATVSGIATASTAALLVYILFKISEEPKHKPGAKLDSRPMLAFGGGFFLY